MRNLILYALLAVGLLMVSSCVRHRQLINLRNDTAAPTADGYAEAIRVPELVVQPEDILYITVNSVDDRASVPFNIGASSQGGGGGGAGGGNQNQLLLLQGYAVDSSGRIDFPNIGLIEVGGLTVEGVREVVAQRVRPFLSSAVINVKFLNFRYTVLGDVVRPGTFTSVSERVSVLEALGTAGDLTPYANRNNVFVIREKDGQRTVKQLDLQSTDFLDSDYYYLVQNDVIYVEPSQAKVATVADPVNRIISYGSAALSVITLALTVFRLSN